MIPKGIMQWHLISHPPAYVDWIVTNVQLQTLESKAEEEM